MNSQDLLGLLGLGFGIYSGVKAKKQKQEAEKNKQQLMRAAIASAIATNYRNRLTAQNLKNEEIQKRMAGYNPTSDPGYSALYSSYLLQGKFPDKLYEKLYPAAPKTIKYEYSGLGNKNHYYKNSGGGGKDKDYKNFQKRSDEFLKSLQKTSDTTFIPTDEYIKTLYERAGKADYWAKKTNTPTKYINMVNQYVKKIREEERKKALEDEKKKSSGLLTSITNIFKSNSNQQKQTKKVKALQKKLLKRNKNYLGFEP